jgi:type 2 lantibiotic biosynthesis protein LanM
LALGALQDLKKILQDKESRFKLTKQIGIGGADGLGSIVYASIRIGQFVNEPTLIELARLAASSITQESIASDRYFDIIAGTGGAILGLLTLYQATQDPAILERATACGYHLLSNRVASNSEHRAWVTLENKLLTGFAHGAAGIAYALLRLYETTQNSVFLEGAKEAIAYERSVFSPTNGNWPDLRSPKLSFMTSWCHGAAGIGLARLGSLMILDTEEIRQEIAISLNTIQQLGLQNLDRLCCGNFGRMEVWLVAASKLSRFELRETAQKQAAQVVNRVKHLGVFYLFTENLKDIYNPSFFQGTAGIGYELLRLAYPDLLPSILLWE